MDLEEFKVSENMGIWGQTKGPRLGVRSPRELLEPWLLPLTHCVMWGKPLPAIYNKGVVSLICKTPPALPGCHLARNSLDLAASCSFPICLSPRKSQQDRKKLAMANLRALTWPSESERAEGDSTLWAGRSRQ